MWIPLALAMLATRLARTVPASWPRLRGLLWSLAHGAHLAIRICELSAQGELDQLWRALVRLRVRWMLFWNEERKRRHTEHQQRLLWEVLEELKEEVAEPTVHAILARHLVLWVPSRKRWVAELDQAFGSWQRRDAWRQAVS